MFPVIDTLNLHKKDLALVYIGHKSVPSYRYSKPTQEGPSPGVGHKSVPSYKYSIPTQEGPSPGIGHKNVPGDYQ